MKLFFVFLILSIIIFIFTLINYNDDFNSAEFMFSQHDTEITITSILDILERFDDVADGYFVELLSDSLKYEVDSETFLNLLITASGSEERIQMKDFIYEEASDEWLKIHSKTPFELK